MGLSLFVVASQICEFPRNSPKIQIYSNSRSSKVIDIGANLKHICNFLLVTVLNFGHLLPFSRYWHMATVGVKWYFCICVILQEIINHPLYSRRTSSAGIRVTAGYSAAEFSLVWEQEMCISSETIRSWHDRAGISARIPPPGIPRLIVCHLCMARA